ncbi:Dihydrofolate reductase [Roseovarius albus]|uniref:Dihydrofolate reductase n=1 Tax=Roseovarius albus TaxID=1247867 RepID=A0A1X6ZC69_9RHOB|nr:dihydrofolate reductase [Roseovarius albus]SLN46781.1 Dihydrofolate reductase [Roseovarius albus]
MITLIAARARNGAIGRDGDMPWHLPEDLAFFKRETEGGAVIMGRKTWNSLPEAVRPLPGRLNLVVSSNPDCAPRTFGTIEDAIAEAEGQGYRRIYCIGGGQLYAGMMPIADRLIVTEVDLMVDDADTFFPVFSGDNWHQIGQVILREEAPACVAHEYLRR